MELIVYGLMRYFPRMLNFNLSKQMLNLYFGEIKREYKIYL